jgi:hypothetical protein
MDRVLDALEGRPDSLPEHWIDGLERIESDFAAWVVEAEKYKVHNQWLRAQQEAKAAALAVLQSESKNLVEETRQDPVSIGSPSEPANNGDQKLAKTRPEQWGLENSFRETLNLTQPSVEQAAVDESSPPAFLPVQPDAKTSATLVTSLQDKQEAPIPATTTEDLTTPTQAEFSLSTLSLNGQLSAGQTPRANGSFSENKENIPPSIPQTDGSRSPPGNSTDSYTFTEHRDLFEDPFARPSTAEARIQLPAVTVSANMPPVENPVVPATAKLPRSEIATPSEAVQVHVPRRESETCPKSRFVDRSLHRDNQTPEEIPQKHDVQPAGVFSPELPSGTSDIRMPRVRSSVKNSTQNTVAAGSASRRNSAGSQSQIPNPVKKADTPRTVRKPLQSPIKLAKNRSGRLSLDKEPQLSPKITRRRRTSTGSVRSLLSDHSSLISSPDMPGLRTISSNETPISAQSHPESAHPSSHGDHRLREDRLRRLENIKSDPRVSFQQNRTVSLPLERFINERLEMGLGGESANVSSRQPVKASSSSVGLPQLAKVRGAEYIPNLSTGN